MSARGSKPDGDAVIAACDNVLKNYVSDKYDTEWSAMSTFPPPSTWLLPVRWPGCDDLHWLPAEQIRRIRDAAANMGGEE